MLDGVSLASPFGIGEEEWPEAGPWIERFDPLAEITSFSLHFDLGASDESPSSANATLTFFVESPGPSVCFGLSVGGLSAGKAGLSGTARVTGTEVGLHLATGEGLATMMLPGTVGRFARTFRNVDGAQELVGRFWAGFGRVVRGNIRTGVQEVRGSLFEMRVALEFGPDAVQALGREGDILLKTGVLIEAKSGGSLFVGAGKMGQFGKYIQMRNSGQIDDLVYFFGRDPDPRTVELLYRHGVDWFMI